MTELVDARRSSRHTHASRALAIVVSSTFVSMLAYAGPLGNAATLGIAFDASAASAAWILASMSMGLAVTLLPVGVIADHIGRLRVFRSGAVGFILANLICALSGSSTVFGAGRFLTGLAAAAMIATGLGLVVANSDKDRVRTATWWSVAMGSGIAIGPIVAGLLDLTSSWRTFYLMLAATGVMLGLATRRLEHSGSRPATVGRRLDVLGVILLTATLTAVVTALIESRSGFTARATVVFGAGALGLLAFVSSQLARRTTLIDRRLLTHRPFLAATIAGLATGLGVIALMSYTCTFLVDAHHLTTLQAALLLAAWSGTSAIAALATSRLTISVSGAALLIGGLSGVALGMALLSGLPSDSSVLRLLPGLIVAGAASGTLNTGLARQAIATVPAEAAAMGAGTNNTARYLGATIGVSLISTVANTGIDASAGWRNAVWVAVGISTVGAIVVAALSTRRQA